MVITYIILMARPHKNTAEWYKHSRDFRNEPRVKAVRKRFRNDGYAVIHYFFEEMIKCEHFEMQYNDLLKKIYSADFDVTEKKLDQIVDYCTDLNLLGLNPENGYLYSPLLNDLLQELMESRVKDRHRKEKSKDDFPTENGGFPVENYGFPTEKGGFPVENAIRIEENRKEEKRIDDDVVEENRIENNSQSSLFVPSTPTTVSDGAEQLKKDRKWILLMMYKFVMEKENLLKWVNDFVVECNCRGKEIHVSLADIKQHFNNWLVMKIKSIPSKNDGKEGLSVEQRWILCYVELCLSVTADVGKKSYDNLQFDSYDEKKCALSVKVPNKEVYEYIVGYLGDSALKIIKKHFGAGVRFYCLYY